MSEIKQSWIYDKRLSIYLSKYEENVIFLFATQMGLFQNVSGMKHSAEC